MTIEELRERLEQLNTDAHDIKAKAEAEKRDLTTEESRELEQILDRFDDVKNQIEQLQRLEVQTSVLHKPSGRRSEADDVADDAPVDEEGESVALCCSVR